MTQQNLQLTVELLDELGQVNPNDLREQDAQNVWHGHAQGRLIHEQLSLLLALYTKILEADILGNNHWPWKATTLVKISECFWVMNFPCLAKRYAMLALCDEASRAPITAAQGTYQRLLRFHGMLEREILRYATRIRQLYDDHSEYRRFPESILAELDDEWIVEVPSNQESSQYVATGTYIRYLLGKLNWLHQQQNADVNEKGRLLEKLAAYCLFCMPGARVRLRVPEEGTGTDRDVVCSLEGHTVDFRTELGRYFVAECKANAETKTPFDVAAKFARSLSKVKAKFGILFCPQGVTGQFKDTHAQKEQLDLYRDSGIVMVLLTERNLQHIASGRNLINILRFKYDQVRLLQKIKEDEVLDAEPAGWIPWTFPAAAVAAPAANQAIN